MLSTNLCACLGISAFMICALLSAEVLPCKVQRPLVWVASLYCVHCTNGVMTRVPVHDAVRSCSRSPLHRRARSTGPLQRNGQGRESLQRPGGGGSLAAVSLTASSVAPSRRPEGMKAAGCCKH